MQYRALICKFFCLIALTTSMVFSSEEPVICLTMIVKNESAIIERCLNRVKDIIDCVSICDTGSTDNTVEIIEKFLETHHIPGKVYHHEWKNFGHNRSLSFTAGKKTLEQLGIPLSRAYMLLLDADMELVMTPDFKKSQLEEDHYLVLQKLGGVSYYNSRFIKASLPWHCIGVTHEYWVTPSYVVEDKLDTVWINDRGDGGCKADKFERDARLLLEGLKEEPNNVRYMFYLAQTYSCLNQYEEAIKWYKKRIEQKGWEEEVYYAKFMVGSMYEAMGQWDNALIWYLDAYQHNPKRAEPLDKIALHYRTAGQHALAYLFALQGSKIPYPKDQLLFVSDPVYEYRFDEELSISAYYTPFREEGFAANERVIFNKKAPYSVKEQALRNSCFYITNLKNVSFKPMPVQLPPIREGSDLSFNGMNPSILKTKEGYLIVCRCVNYLQKGAANYRMIDPEKKEIEIRTRNMLLRCDKDFNVISQKEILDDLFPPLRKEPLSHIEGLEDIRLFEYDQAYWFTCCVRDIDNHSAQIGLFKLGDSSTGDCVLTKYFKPLKGPDLQRCEKNWLPFVKNEEVHVIYSYDPFVIYKVNTLDGTCTEVVGAPQKYDFSRFRGSAGPIPFDDGYLAIVHEVTFNAQGRVYFHRFIALDRNYKITHFSRPFTYQHQGVEYCCGMSLDHEGSKLIMSIGIEDAKALLAFIDVDHVRSLLIPVP